MLAGRGDSATESFSEEVCEVEADGLRYVLRKNQAEAARQRHRLDDKLAKLTQKMEQRNQQVKESTRCKPEAGQRQMQAWIARHKLSGLVDVGLEGRALVLERKPAAVERAMELTGCYVVVTDVAKQRMQGQAVMTVT